MRQPNQSVSLVNEINQNVTVRLIAWTDDDGLVLEGQDVGPVVSTIWGDSDYEYWLRVVCAHLDQIADRLSKRLDKPVELPDRPTQSDRVLLDLMRDAWSVGMFKTDVEFRNWLNDIDVPSEFSSYT